MTGWIGRLLVAGGVLYLLGWALVLLSGYGGDSTGGSELVWRVGGVMVYVAIPWVLIGGLLALADSLRARCSRRSAAPF